MNLLILGGTQFVGRHLVDAALARGHRVTLMHRGTTNPDLFPDVEHRLGDRDGGLDVLAGGTWDVAIDTCGYVPRIVGASAKALAGVVERYVFVSTISVYSEFSPGLDENGPLGSIDDPTVEEITGETYGPLKVRCERAVEEHFSGRCLHVRPGLIVGPHDPTDRFTYWVARADRGGRFVAPGEPGSPFQIIDARDLGEWIVRAVENGLLGTFNTTGPAEPTTLGETLEACVAVAGEKRDEAPSLPTWIPDDFLAAHDVPAWTGLPLWVPAGFEGGNFLEVSSEAAIAEGLVYRPLADTIRDTLAWHRSRPEFRPDGTGLGVGISPEAETDLLAAWDARPPAATP